MASAFYGHVPKVRAQNFLPPRVQVVLCIWLLPLNTSTEAWLLRISLIAFNGMRLGPRTLLRCL